MNSIFWKKLWIWKLFNIFAMMRGCNSTNNPTDITHRVSKSDLFRLDDSMKEHLVANVSFFCPRVSLPLFTCVLLHQQYVSCGCEIALRNCSVLFCISCLVHYISVLPLGAEEFLSGFACIGCSNELTLTLNTCFHFRLISE